jgi:hypothetical protein
VGETENRSGARSLFSFPYTNSRCALAPPKFLARKRCPGVRKLQFRLSSRPRRRLPTWVAHLVRNVASRAHFPKEPCGREPGWRAIEKLPPALARARGRRDCRWKVLRAPSTLLVNSLLLDAFVAFRAARPVKSPKRSAHGFARTDFARADFAHEFARAKLRIPARMPIPWMSLGNRKTARWHLH